MVDYVVKKSDENSERKKLNDILADIATRLATVETQQPAIQFKNSGSNIGTTGEATTVNFAGAGVVASFSSGTITVTIP